MDKLINEVYIVQKRGPADKRFNTTNGQIIPVKNLEIVSLIKRMVSPDEGMDNPHFRAQLVFVNEGEALKKDIKRFSGISFLQGARFEETTLNEDNCHLLVEGCCMSGLLCMDSVCASSAGLSIPMRVISLDAKLPFKK